MLIGLYRHIQTVYLYESVAVRTLNYSGVVKRLCSVNMSEQQETGAPEGSKKSAAQLKKEAKKKEKLEKYEAKMKAMEASKAATADVSGAQLLE